MAGARKKTSKEFVYGNWGGIALCVLPREKAEELAEQGDDFDAASYREYIDICRAKTAVYDSEWVDDLVDYLDEFGISLDSLPRIDQMPGNGDGWFPIDARTSMLDALPEEVFETDLGRVVDEMGGMPRFDIEPADLPCIIEVLEELGYEVRKAQSLFDRMLS